jgi:type I restriction-modification system DNA methylase subunit
VEGDIRNKTKREDSTQNNREDRMITNNSQLEARLWGAADELRANSKLKASEYSIPVLGLIFLRYAGLFNADK